ncbi:MAG: DegV family protein [Actinobacteria bacterium]|nr:DegV family protein [Actinomycetota bacterium]
MTVAVVTDSAASLPEELVRKYGIGVVPIRVVIGGIDHADGELPLADVVGRLDEGVSTSAPAPGEWRAAIDAASERASSVLVLTIASAMSATHEAAVVAASDAPGDVVVIDSLTAAGAEALVVLAAAQAADDGQPLDGVVTAAERVRDAVRLVATVDSLDHLVRSGRVPGIAGFAGRVLGVNPLFEFARGRVRPLRPAFSREAALDRIVQACLAGRRKHEGPLHVAALHADDEATARRLLAAATYKEDPAEAFIGSFSAAMIAHTGPALAGLAWWWE